MTPPATASNIPPLDETGRAHQRAVAAALADALRTRDWLSFAEYLQIVLYAPGLGYYSAGATKFGHGGDFITAPELSPLFARAVARQCAAILQQLSDGEILELGAGTGRLAADTLRTLDTLGVLPRRYLILEVSADLAARQQALLHTLPAHLAERVVWLDRLPAAINGIVLANEVADALPFERFVVRPEGFDLRGVGLAPAVIGGSDTLQSIDRPAPAALAAELARISAALPMHLPSGYVSEICPLLGPWIGSLAASLARGVVLLFDYGLGRAEYYHPQRDTGTMRCHFRHRAHDDPLLYPGLQDITAWVDFTRVAEAAVDHGLEVAGFCTQAAFLLANGIEADVAAAASDVERARLAAAARQLLLPGEMGEHFKLMALTRDCFAGLDVFALQDLRRLL